MGFWPCCMFCFASGEKVERNLCTSNPTPEPVPCEVPCSRDCVLSDWTSWSTCSQTCSSKTIEGKQMRTRSILAYNAGEGESGPANSRLFMVYGNIWRWGLNIGLVTAFQVVLCCHSSNVWISVLCMCICPYLKQSAYLSWWLFLLVCLLAWHSLFYLALRSFLCICLFSLWF